jgi:hypothetical protein
MFAETAVTQRRERERKGKKNDDRTDKWEGTERKRVGDVRSVGITPRNTDVYC